MEQSQTSNKVKPYRVGFGVAAGAPVPIRDEGLLLNPWLGSWYVEESSVGPGAMYILCLQ